MSITTTNNQKNRRRSERVTGRLKTIVQIGAADSGKHKEITEVTTVSRNGAEFSITRRCQIGQLLTLVMAMPAELRLYDQDDPLYAVAAVVQNCYESTMSGLTNYHVGVAFIGKTLPDSYLANPMQSYRLSGVNRDGSWKVTEASSPFQVRRDHRSSNNFEVDISMVDEETGVVLKESTETRNISARGACVWSSLDAQIGDEVTITSDQHSFETNAVVRNCRVTGDGHKTMHVEFVDNRFPMERLAMSLTQSVAGETAIEESVPTESVIEELAVV